MTAPRAKDPKSSSRTGTRTQWMLYALASGACAALNGVFAKLTSTSLTSSLSHAAAHILHLPQHEAPIEITIRGIFFALNLTFNGIMWTLFTNALAKAPSTTQVSVLNTSANFVATALLGFFVFAEALPVQWWVGASVLLVGNVLVGRKDEGPRDRDDGQVAPLGNKPGGAHPSGGGAADRES